MRKIVVAGKPRGFVEVLVIFGVVVGLQLREKIIGGIHMGGVGGGAKR